MRSLSVEASSLESARALHSALAEFHPELSGSEDEGYRVTVELGSFDRKVISVLDAIEEHVSIRNDGAARINLDGRTYTLPVAAAAAT
jgi:hypothetical protein